MIKFLMIFWFYLIFFFKVILAKKNRYFVFFRVHVRKNMLMHPSLRVDDRTATLSESHIEQINSP